MIYFIANARSGKGRGQEIADKINAYMLGKAEFTICYTKYREHAVSLAKELSQKKDCDAIVAVGGDGTFSEVLNGADLKHPVGFIPSGSGNDFIRTTGERTLEARLDDIIDGKYKNIDFISVNEKRCLNVLGGGFDVDVLENEAHFRKMFKGSICYYLGLLKALLCIRFRPMSMVVDENERIECESLIFALANGKYYGGGMPVSLDSKIDDGKMDLLIIKKLPLYKVPYVLVKFLNGSVREIKEYTASRVCTSFSCYLGNISMQIDGEIKKIEKIECKIITNQLKAFL